MCPFKLLRILAQAFSLQNSGQTTSKKVGQNNEALTRLNRWRMFTDSRIHIPLLADICYAETLLSQNKLPTTNYSTLERLYGEKLVIAQRFAINELINLIEFSRDTDQPENMQFANNICFSFHELLTILEIALVNLSHGQVIDNRLVRLVRKITLNNATHHNSIGGGMLHLYMKYHESRALPVFTWKDNNPVHTTPFMSFVVTSLEEYVDVISWFNDLSPEEREYQQELLFMLCVQEQGEQVLKDPEAAHHFSLNYFHGKERRGCPYLRGRHLGTFVDGVLNPFCKT